MHFPNPESNQSRPAVAISGALLFPLCLPSFRAQCSVCVWMYSIEAEFLIENPLSFLLTPNPAILPKMAGEVRCSPPTLSSVPSIKSMLMIIALPNVIKWCLLCPVYNLWIRFELSKHPTPRTRLWSSVNNNDNNIFIGASRPLTGSPMDLPTFFLFVCFFCFFSPSAAENGIPGAKHMEGNHGLTWYFRKTFL